MNECHSCDDLLSQHHSNAKTGESLQFVREGGRRSPRLFQLLQRFMGMPSQLGTEHKERASLRARRTLSKGKDQSQSSSATTAAGTTRPNSVAVRAAPICKPNRSSSRGAHQAVAASTEGFAYTTTLGIEIPFLRVCKDKMAGAVNNSQFALMTDKQKDSRDSEFIRKKGRCKQPTTGWTVKSGRGPKDKRALQQLGAVQQRLPVLCFSLCNQRPNLLLTALRGGGLEEVPDYTISSSKALTVAQPIERMPRF